MQVSEEGVVPTAERKVCQRSRHADIDPDHAGLDPVLELAGRLAGLGVDAGTIAEGRGIGHLDRRLEVIEAHDIENGAKHFLLGDLHPGADLVDDRRPEIEAVGFRLHLNFSSVHHQRGSLLHAGIDQALDPVQVLGTDHRPHPLAVFTVGGTNVDRLHRLGQRIQQPLGRLADRHGRGAGHTALTGTTKGSVDQPGHRVPKIGIGQDEDVILGAAGGLYPLPVLVPRFVDVLGDGGRSDKGDRTNQRMREQGIDALPSTMDDVEDTGRQTGLLQQLDQADAGERYLLAGLEDEGVSAGDRQREHPHRHQSRKVVGADSHADAVGLAHHLAVDPAGHILQDLSLEELRNAAGVFHHLDAAAKIPPRLHNVLTMFAGDAFRQGLKFILEKHLVTEQDPGPLHWRGFRPVGKSPVGVFHRQIDNIGSTHRGFSDHLPGGGIINRGGLGGLGRRPFSPDKIRDGIQFGSGFLFRFGEGLRHGRGWVSFHRKRVWFGTPSSSCVSCRWGYPPS